ncbi:hypothetical protein ABH935_005354 [Catenulispora sp. GAS73]|uniref:AAA family ATPase n=1 Tax=Catenulispora sp. GAS73 TaxID=3156269 RepID=UPI00351671A2
MNSAGTLEKVEAFITHTSASNILEQIRGESGESERHRWWLHFTLWSYRDVRFKLATEADVTAFLRETCEKLNLSGIGENTIHTARRAILDLHLSISQAEDLGEAGIETEKACEFIPLADVAAESIEWLWLGYIPMGKMTIVDGDPGVSKSTAALDFAARVSTGRKMPDGTAGLDRPRGVLIMSAEDGLADTIRPRLDVAKADMDRVHSMTSTTVHNGETGETSERPAILPDDFPQIERFIRCNDIGLVIVDPLMAFLGDKTNSWNDQSMRRALFPLSQMADATGAAILVVRHFNKGSGGKATNRGGGSIATIGNARAAFMIAPHPDDDPNQGDVRRLFACTKINVAGKPSTLVYRLVPEGKHCRIQWEGESPYTADQLIAAEVSGGNQRKSASAFLLEALKDGPRPTVDVEEEASELGISERTLNSARKKLGVKAIKPKGKGNAWWMSLPEPGEAPEDVKGAVSP